MIEMIFVIIFSRLCLTKKQVLKPLKVIESGKDALKANEDMVAPRTMKPWQKIENLKEDGSFKEKEVKSMAFSISEAKTLNETDAREFDDLLELPATSTQSTASDSQTASTSKQTTTTSARMKSVIVKVEEETKEDESEEEFVVKRPWAWKAETDEEAVYFPNRRTKCFESIKDLMTWTRKNVVDFEPGKMFETLLSTEELFNDPGLENHPSSDDYFNRLSENQNAGRKSNSFEFGFRCFARKIFMVVFKEKAYGLVNRNFTGLRGWNKQKQMKALGKFMDKVLTTAERVDYEFEEDVRYELDRFEVEKIKDEFIPFTTNNKAGSYEIEVYSKDVSIGEDEWLLLLLKHTAFAWENLTMMRAKQKANRSSRLQLFFPNLKVGEYFEGVSHLDKLIRNPNILAPGTWSKLFM